MCNEKKAPVKTGAHRLTLYKKSNFNAAAIPVYTYGDSCRTSLVRYPV